MMNDAGAAIFGRSLRRRRYRIASRTPSAAGIIIVLGQWRDGAV